MRVAVYILLFGTVFAVAGYQWGVQVHQFAGADGQPPTPTALLSKAVRMACVLGTFLGVPIGLGKVRGLEADALRLLSPRAGLFAAAGGAGGVALFGSAAAVYWAGWLGLAGFGAVASGQAAGYAGGVAGVLLSLVVGWLRPRLAPVWDRPA